MCWVLPWPVTGGAGQLQLLTIKKSFQLSQFANPAPELGGLFPPLNNLTELSGLRSPSQERAAEGKENQEKSQSVTGWWGSHRLACGEQGLGGCIPGMASPVRLARDAAARRAKRRCCKPPRVWGLCRDCLANLLSNYSARQGCYWSPALSVASLAQP